MSVAPAPEAMEREPMVSPPIIANLTFGGMVLVAEQGGQQKGLMCNPMGMLTVTKMITACCCSCCLEIDMTYVDPDYKKAISIETKSEFCNPCMQPHFAVSLKDYTADKMKPVKTVVGVSRKKGQPEGCKMKSYKQPGCGYYARWGVKYPQSEGGGDAFYIKNKVSCLKCLTCPGCDNCSALTKGKMCMNYKVPVYNPKREVVAHVVQTVPLVPTSCCQATAGPTIQMSIHKADTKTEFSDEDVARLSMFLFTLTPNVPGGGGSVYFISKLLNMFLMQTGWLLGSRMDDVQVEYLTPKEVFNGEVAGFGDILDKIRGK